MSDTNAKEMRSNVLKKLAKTFDVGHLAEAFDVLFDVIKKQGDEIKVLKDKLETVDQLQANVKELTSCMKVLEYNIQGFDVKAPDSLLPAVQVLSLPAGSKGSGSKRPLQQQQQQQQQQADKHDIHHMADAVEEVMEVPLPVHINHEEMLPDPSFQAVQVQRSNTSSSTGGAGNGFLSSALKETHYKSVLYHDPSSAPKPKKTHDKPSKTMISISYERRQQMLYRLRKVGHKIKENRGDFTGMLYCKNTPDRSIMGQIQTLEARHAGQEQAIETLGQGLEQFQNYLQSAFPHSFFVNMRKMQAFIESANKAAGGLHALAGLEGAEVTGMSHRHKHKHHHHHNRSKDLPPMLASPMKEPSLNAFAEEEEEEEEEEKRKSPAPITTGTEGTEGTEGTTSSPVTEEKGEEEEGENKKAEKSKSPSPVETKAPSPKSESPAAVLAPTATGATDSGSESGSGSESEEEEEDDFPEMPSFGGSFSSLRSMSSNKSLGLELHPSAAGSPSGSHVPVKVIHSSTHHKDDHLIMRLEQNDKIPLYICEQVREYLMNVAPLPLMDVMDGRGSIGSDGEEEGFSSSLDNSQSNSYDENDSNRGGGSVIGDDPLDALNEAHNYDKSNVFDVVEDEKGKKSGDGDVDGSTPGEDITTGTVSTATEEGAIETGAGEGGKKDTSPRPVTQERKKRDVSKERDHSHSHSSHSPRGNTRGGGGGSHSPRGGSHHHHATHLHGSPSYIPPGQTSSGTPPPHTTHLGGYASHAHANNDKLYEKKFADMNKLIDNKVSKGDFEQMRHLVQDLMHQSMTREEADAMLDDCFRPEDVLKECRMNEHGELVPVEPDANDGRRRMYDPRSDKLRKCIENIAKNATGSGTGGGIGGLHGLSGLMGLNNAPSSGLGDDNVVALREALEEHLEDKLHKDRKRHEKDREAFNHEIGALRKELDALNESVKSQMQDDKSALTAWKPELDALREKLVEITEEQKAEASKMADDLAQITTDIGVRPTERDVSAMVKVIETGFKQRLGENIGDVKATVNAVINAVKQKSSKDEVAAIISQRMAGLEQKLQAQKEEEESKAAMSIKCLSCGMLHKTNALKAGDGRNSPEHPRLLEMIKSVPNSKEDYEAMVAVLQRTAGLRSINRTHMPIDSSSNSSVASAPVYMPTTSLLKEGEKIAPEPLYRRAKLAAHMKELVKVPLSSVKLTNSADAYPDKRYVMDTSLQSSRSNTSLPGLNLNSPHRGSLGSSSNNKRDLLLNRQQGGGYSNFKQPGGYNGSSVSVGGASPNPATRTTQQLFADDAASVTSEITIGSQGSIVSSAGANNKLRKMLVNK